MLGHNRAAVPANLFAGFQPDTPPHGAINELESTMIAGYEQALCQGLSPNRALSVILTWAATECGRLKCEAEAPA